MRNNVFCFHLSPRCAVWLSAVMFSVNLLAQSTLYVAVDGDDAAGNGSEALPYKTISNAVAKAAAGDTVLIGNGDYALTAELNIAKKLTVRGQNGRDYVVIQGGPDTRCVYMNHAQAVLDGVTLSNGAAADNDRSGYGGGAYLENGNLLNCSVKNCQAAYGGGVYLKNGLATNCCFSNNLALSTIANGGGGGAAIFGGASLLQCQIANNISTSVQDSTYGCGGGVLSLGGLVSDCVLSGNTASGSGGGMAFNGAATMASNCVIESNQAHEGAGAAVLQFKGTLADCIIRNNRISSSSGNGGGVLFRSSVTGFIAERCDISNNWATGNGGGLNIAGKSVLVSNCTINANVVTNGSSAGVYMSSASTVTCSRIVNNLVVSDSPVYGVGFNIAAGDGEVSHCVIQGNIGTNATKSIAIYDGGLRVTGAGTVRNCLIADNQVYSAGYGGGVSFVNSGSACKIESCTIANNYAHGNGGGVYFLGDGADTIFNSIVYHNRATSGAEVYDTTGNRNQTTFYNSCSGWLTALNNNITSDPAFIDVDGDYRLDSLSPCINAGAHQDWMDAGVDLDGHPRIDRMGQQVDMGCYEHIFHGTFFRLR